MEGNKLNADIFNEPNDATPLSEEEKEGLIPSYISTREELNQAEQANIAKAHLWVFDRVRNPLDVVFLRKLHKEMFGEVWKWAGTYRKTERNIGVDSTQIQLQLKQLIDETIFQIECQSYTADEIAARFHHRLVYIHPFPNGNGRLSRMATDLLLQHMGRERFTWGAEDLESKSEIRSRYIEALKAADQYDYSKLLAFVRSGKKDENKQKT